MLYTFKDFQFNPDRYLNGNRLEQHVIPFGTGKRECLGKSLALAELYLVDFFFNFTPSILNLDNRQYAASLQTRTSWISTTNWTSFEIRHHASTEQIFNEIFENPELNYLVE